MKVKFAWNLEIDTDNVPENFEEMILESFKGFTYGTSKDYTYQDKLCYIDNMRKYVHNSNNTTNSVMDLMKEYFEKQVLEYGEFPTKSDFLSVEFMEECFEKGRTNLCDCYTNNRCTNDVIMQLVFRAVKVVINWEPEL